MVLRNIFQPVLCDIDVSGIMNAIADWFSTAMVEVMDAISDEFLTLFNTDMSAFVGYFPFATATYDIIQATAWVLLIMIVVFQLLRNTLGPLTDAEKPTTLIGRAVISAFCIGYAMPICDILLKLCRDPYNALLNYQAEANDFTWASLSGTLTNLFGNLFSMSGLGVIVMLLLVIAIAWNYVKLLLEVVERYVVLGVLTYTSPLGFTLAGSHSLANSFKAWCRMYGAQLIMMLMNVWFLRGFNFAMGGYIASYGTITPSGYEEAKDLSSPILFWMFAILAFLRTAQAVDRHLSAVGLSVAQTGVGLGQELMHTGMSLMMGARMMSMGMGRGATTTGGGAATRMGRIQNRMNPASYALDAARVNAQTQMGGHGFISQSLRNSAAQNLANGTSLLTPNQVGMVANALPRDGMGNIVDGGNNLGNIGSSSLKSFMPQLNDANLQDTNIGAGKMTTTAVGADGSMAQLTFLNANQTGAMPDGAIKMQAADGSQWYMSATGSGAGAFSNAASISPEGEPIGERFKDAGFDSDATVQSIGDGAIRITDSNGTSDWLSTMNHDVGDVAGQYMTADNGEVFFSQTPIADTSGYIGSPEALTADFGRELDGRNITNVQGAGAGQFEFYDSNNGSWYRASDSNYYEQPQNSTRITDNSGHSYYVEQAQSRITNVPVNDKHGNPIMETIKTDGGTKNVVKTETKITRGYSNIRSKRGIRHK